MANPLLSHEKQYNSLLIRVFPSLNKINGEYINNLQSPFKNVATSSMAKEGPFQKLHSLVKTLQAYRSFNTKQLFQKILITFAGTTSAMKLQKSLLPFILVERLLKTSLTKDASGSLFRVLDDELFYRNLQEVYRQRASCRTITNYIVTKRVR